MYVKDVCKSLLDALKKIFFGLGVQIFCEWRHMWSSFGVILAHVTWPRAQPLGQSVSLKFPKIPKPSCEWPMSHTNLRTRKTVGRTLKIWVSSLKIKTLLSCLFANMKNGWAATGIEAPNSLRQCPRAIWMACKDNTFAHHCTRPW